jgi:hypothetical protein
VVLQLLRSVWSWAVLGGGWRHVTIAGRALVTPEACGASATRTRPGPWGTLLVGQADGRVPICGAQRPTKLRLAVTLVDDDHDVGACMVCRHIDSCEAVATTARQRCTSRRRCQGGG